MFRRLESFCVLCDILHSVIGGTCTRFTQIGPLINYMWRFVLSFYSLFSICIPNTKTVQELFSKFLEKVIQFSVQSEKLSIARENRWKLLNKHRWQVYVFSLHIYFFFLHTHALTAAYFEREFGGLLERHTLKRELHMNRKIPQCSCHFPYFDKNISITHWKSAGSWSRPLWGKNVKRIHGLEASYLLQRHWFVRIRVRELRAWLHNTPAASDWLLENEPEIACPWHCIFICSRLSTNFISWLSVTQGTSLRSASHKLVPITRLLTVSMAERIHLTRRRQVFESSCPACCEFQGAVFVNLFILFCCFHQASKPLLERQRRARINRSLEELKGLVLSAIYRDVSLFLSLQVYPQVVSQ